MHGQNHIELIPFSIFWEQCTSHVGQSHILLWL